MGVHPYPIVGSAARPFLRLMKAAERGLGLAVLIVLAAQALCGTHRARAQALSVQEVSGVDFKSVDFDVPIPVTIPWPESIQSQIAELDLPEIEQRLRVYRIVSRREPPLVRFPNGDDGACSSHGCWEDVTATTSSRADATGLHAVLERLRPNRYYQFRFTIRRSLTNHEEVKFKAGAVAALDSLFREPISGALNESTRRQIQHAMLEAVRAATAMDVSARRGSLFDDTISDAEHSAGSADALDVLYSSLGALATMSSEINRQQIARNLTPGVRKTGALHTAAEAVENLRRLDSTLIDLHLFLSELRIDERRSGITASSMIDSLHVLSLAAYQLAVLDDSAGLLLTNGQYALSPYGAIIQNSGAIADVWTPEQLAQRRMNIEMTAQSIGRIAYLVEQVRHLRQYRQGSQGRQIGDVEIGVLYERLQNAREALLRVPDYDEAFRALSHDVAKRRILLATFVDEAVERFAEAEVYATASSTATFETRATTYVSADLGVLYVRTSEDVAPYFGVNVYPFPVNKEAPLRSFDFAESLLRRTAFMFGVTTTSVERPDRREGIVGESGLLAGVGVRITDIVRLSTGALFFRALDPASPPGESSLDRSTFVSLSLDWNVEETLGGLRDALFD